MKRGVLWRKSPTPRVASLQIFGHLPQISPPLQWSVQRSRTSSFLESPHLLCASYPVWSPDLYLDSTSHSDEQQPIIPEEIRCWLWVCSLYPPVNHRLKRWLEAACLMCDHRRRQNCCYIWLHHFSGIDFSKLEHCH